MSDQYVGEIRIFAGNFPPQGWAFCDGSLLPIAQYDVLYALIGTTYGGDGQTNFALPDLRGRVVLNTSQTHRMGEKSGAETVQLNLTQVPGHTHMPQAAATPGDQPSPTGNVWAAQANNPFAPSGTGMVTMNAQAISAVGGSQPHDNMQPYLTVSFIIATEGIFPNFS